MSRTRKSQEKPKQKSGLWTIIAIAALCLFALQSLLAAPRLSVTSDEIMHLAAGYSYWETKDFRLNPEHPPLAKLLASAPLLFIKPRLDTSGEEWKTAAQNQLGYTFLYSNDADRVLFWSRVPMILLAAIGGLITFLWARDLFGPMAGAFAAVLYSFCPNLLAHGMLVTTDVPVGTFILLTLYLFWRQRGRPTWQSSLLIGLALGAAMTSKYSGALLPVLIAGLSIVRALRQKNRQEAFVVEIKSLAIMAAASLAVIEAAYLFTASPLLYFQNSSVVNANHIRTYDTYLMGELKQGGWWYYFLAAFLFKATIATLILLLLAAIQTFLGMRESWSDTILVSAIAFFVIAYSWQADNIGVRYLLPVFPLLYVWGSRIVPAYSKTRWGTVALAGLLSWQMWAAVSSFPDYIPYFNELAGGSKGGPNVLDDSNVDWGQSIKETAAYVKEKGIQNFVFCPFSPYMNGEYYGLNATLRPPKHLVFTKPEPGTYIISAHNVAWMRATDPDWRRYQPIDFIGGSMWVYRF